MTLGEVVMLVAIFAFCGLCALVADWNRASRTIDRHMQLPDHVLKNINTKESQ